MKISPLVGGGMPGVSLNEGGLSGDRMARAKAIAAGQEPTQATGDPQADRAQQSIQKIKLRTQVSPETQSLTPELPQSDTLEVNESAIPATEATKPLSPQLAALAKQKREIQLAQKQLADQKAAFEAEKQGLLSGYVSKDALKSSALKTLMAEGVTYDQLTEEILSQNKEFDPAVIDERLKSFEENFEKKLNERQVQAEARQEEAALTSMLNEATQLASQGDDYALIKEANAYEQVLRNIHEHYKKTGEVLEVKSVMDKVENDLLEQSLKWAQHQKIQSRLNPVQQPPVQQDRPGTKTMRTITNRDGVSSASLSRRERAIAAMQGRLK
jgi:hypothetical protein